MERRERKYSKPIEIPKPSPPKPISKPVITSTMKRRMDDMKVRKFLDILNNRVQEKMNQRPIFYNPKLILKDPNSRYYTVCVKVYDYLIELRGKYKNQIDMLLEDYLTCVASYYKRIGRNPYITQYSPSVNNQIMFEERISRFVTEMGDQYWTMEYLNETKVKEMAKRHRALLRGQYKRSQEFSDIGVLEI